MIENKNTPQIRFKGFTDDWEQRKLDKLLEQYTEITKINNQYPALTSSRKGIFFQTEYFAGNQIASENNIGYNIVPRNYFTYRHMSDDEIFYFNINDICDYGIVSTLYPVFTTKKELDSKYLQYKLNFGKEFAKFAVLQKQGGSRTYMYFSKLKELEITIPKVSEQIKIAKLLETTDNLIKLHQSKTEKLLMVKKSMLEKMFPQDGEKIPKWRFKGFTDTWVQYKLRDLVKYRRGSFPQPYGKDEWYGGIGAMPFVQVADVGDDMKLISETKQTISKIAQSMSVFIPKDSVIVTLQGTIGRVAITQYDAYLDRTVLFFDTYLEKNINKYFWAITIKNKFEEERKKAPGAIIKTITKEALSDFDINLTTDIEQLKISKLFNEIDNLITLHQLKLEKLNNIKKSLLEKMFV